MAYTRAWSSTTPLGSRAAKEIDDAIREKMLDLQERINSILATGTDLDDDPLVINPARIGADPATPFTRQILIPPYILFPDTDGVNYNHSPGYVAFSNSGLMSGGIVVPIGYKIKLFEAYLDKGSGTSVSAQLLGTNMSTGVTILDTGLITRSASGIGIVTSAALNYNVTNLDVFRVVANESGGIGLTGKFYGGRITVEIPNFASGY